MFQFFRNTSATILVFDVDLNGNPRHSTPSREHCTCTDTRCESWLAERVTRRDVTVHHEEHGKRASRTKPELNPEQRNENLGGSLITVVGYRVFTVHHFKKGIVCIHVDMTRRNYPHHKPSSLLFEHDRPSPWQYLNSLQVFLSAGLCEKILRRAKSKW